MKCADIMGRNVECLSEKDTILRAAQLMGETGVGFLPICDAQQRVIGVVTDRDLTVRALARGVDAATTSAAMAMTSPPVTCLEQTDVREAEALMAQERKARLVVTDADGHPTGVLSVSDIVEHGSGRQALRTLRAILWREALGPRAGAARGEPLLKDDPVARALPPPSDDLEVRDSVIHGAARSVDTREFPIV